MVSGRHPDTARRSEMARLRSQGLTFADIGRRLGMTRQCVETTLRVAGNKPSRFTATCGTCGAAIHTAYIHIRLNGPTHCTACLARKPDATFGERLRAARLAAGLTLKHIAERSGIHDNLLSAYERGAVE